MDRDHEKRIAAEAAAALVEDGMRVGLGTGSTVAHLLPALARPRASSCAVSRRPRRPSRRARELGLRVEPFTGADALAELDIAHRRRRPGRAVGLGGEGRRSGAHAEKARCGGRTSVSS